MTTETLANAIVAVLLGVPVLRYAMAFQVVEPPLILGRFSINLSWLTGLLFGIGYEAAIWLGFREAASARGRGRKTWWWPLISALLQAGIGIFILAPVLRAEMDGTPLADHLGGAATAWSGVVASATLLALLTVSLSMAVQPKKRGEKRATAEDDFATAKQKPARASFVCQTCGWDEAKSQQALNAHQRIHKDPGNGRPVAQAVVEDDIGVLVGVAGERESIG